MGIRCVVLIEAGRAKDTWGAWWVRRHFVGAEGFTDDGEVLALRRARYEHGRHDVLDIGVGGGRTTPILAPEASSYVGVDVSPGMIDLAREQHPGHDFRVLDARHLDGVGDDSADLVVFSNNGIDAVGREGRADILSELARVVRPGGYVQLSTFNLDGSSYGLRPRWSRLWAPVEQHGLRAVWAAAKRVLTTPMGFRHFRREAPKATRGDGWAEWPLCPHEYRFLVHFASVERVVAELAEHGLQVERMWGSDGVPIDPRASHSSAEYLQVLARRPA